MAVGKHMEHITLDFPCALNAFFFGEVNLVKSLILRTKVRKEELTLTTHTHRERGAGTNEAEL